LSEMEPDLHARFFQPNGLLHLRRFFCRLSSPAPRGPDFF
jgi:hypothetical protein